MEQFPRVKNLDIKVLDMFLKEFVQERPNFHMDELFKFGFHENQLNIMQCAVKHGISNNVFKAARILCNPKTDKCTFMSSCEVALVCHCPTREMITDLKMAIGSKLCSFFNDTSNAIRLGELMVTTITDKELDPKFMYMPLKLCNYYLDIPMLFEAQPHLGHEGLTNFQILCGIQEMVMVSYCILTELYHYWNLPIKNPEFADIISWCFDNPQNPIEKVINKNLDWLGNPFVTEETEEAEESKQKLEINMTNDDFFWILKQTYDFPKILGVINDTYSVNFIKEMLVFVGSKFEIQNTPDNMQFLCSMIIYDFMTHFLLEDFLLETNEE